LSDKWLAAHNLERLAGLADNGDKLLHELNMRNISVNTSNQPNHPNKPPRTRKSSRDSQYPLVSKRVIRSELDISFSTLKNWRLGQNGHPPRLIKGVHWLEIGSRKILYNIELIRDYLHNQDNWESHEIAIANYLKSLPSSQAR